jgi:hypothetical protein
MREAWKRGEPFEEAWFDIALAAHRTESARIADLIQRCNEPKLLTQEVVEALDELEELSFAHWSGDRARILEPPDVAALRIPKGSLSQAERDEINSHVTHTFRFLSQIPWTGHLSSLPEIAYAHHERLNGMGYPRGLKAAQIPPQSKLMAICDVFDALVAADRPYKVAVTVPRSLQILEDEAKAGLLDGDALGIFLEARIFEVTMPAVRAQAERP